MKELLVQDLSVNSPIAILHTGVYNKCPELLNSTIQAGGFPRLHCKHQYNDGILTISEDVRNTIRYHKHCSITHSV